MSESALRDELPRLSHGDHCCMLFSSPEDQYRVTAPFLALGLERGERCVFVGDERSVEAVRWGLKDHGVACAHDEQKGRLVLTSAQEYLDDGHWRSEKMLGFLQKAYDAALLDGFTALRAAGDVSWQVGPRQDFQEVVYYEALLDMFFLGKKMVGMCQYPKDRCPPETLSGILNTHRIAAVDSTVCANVHYMPPELFIEKDEELRGRKRVDWMTSQLVRIKKAEDERDTAQHRLLHTQKMEAIGRFAGGIVHDFNNILTAILGFGDLLRGNPAADPSIRSDAEEICRSGERGAALTRQLLGLCHGAPSRPELLDLNALARGMEKFLGRVIGDKIRIASVLDPALDCIQADPSQMEQVILNLAVNARDAMPAGGDLSLETANVELGADYAQLHPEVSPGPHVMLAVSDTGQGMNLATQARIFEPFFTTKAKGRGTGLGLATVHDIVKRNGGSIFVYSEPGKGTSFKVYFPRAAGAAEARPDARAPLGSLRGTETVLVVDDDDAIRKLVHRVLADNGYTVLDAISSPEALRFCERHKGDVHLMVTDAVMPLMGGPELARRALGLRPNMKVVYMSGYSDDAVVRTGTLEAGAAFLEKPFTPEAVLRAARKALD